MIKYQRVDLFFTLCLIFFIGVHSLNYGYSVPRFRSYPTLLSSAPSNVFIASSSSVGNRTVKEKPGRIITKFASPYTLYYPLTFPQRRGGKNLNFTLVTERPSEEKEKPRVVNRPDSNPNVSISRLSFKKVPAISLTPSLLQDKSYKRLPPVNKNIYTSSNNFPLGYTPQNVGPKDIDVVYSPEAIRQSDVPKQNLVQSLGYPSPQQLDIPAEVPMSFILQKNYKNTKVRYTFPPQSYQTSSGSYTFPPPRQETNQNWPCFCVPYYLCKNGVINSGGRSVAAIRRTARSFKPNFRNVTQYPLFLQPKVMNAYVVEQESYPTQCEGQNVCCRLSFGDDVPRNKDEKYYPVATPRPEPYYPLPPRFPDRESELETCGVRRAYGVHARLRQSQYSAEVSEFGEYPWQIAILRKIEGQNSLYLCGGVLISSQWIATAAHCVKNEQFAPLLIRLGEWDANRRDELYPFIEKEVDSITVHPEFNPEFLYNDLALVRLKTPVDSRMPHITPVCLPNHETLYEDQRCWVSGWGKDFFGPRGEYQSVLKEVDVPVIMREICSSELRNTNLGPDFELHAGFLCAGGEAGKDACTGDGGSPLVCKSGRLWYVVGLVSWGIGCGQPGVPGIYVNILYYIDWINSIIGR